jgi:hypothetical protein
MKEEFLHYLWKYGLFHKDSLTDTEGNPIMVISPGEYNHDSGPDFFNARIRTGDTEWAGNIEIHTKASDFEAHGHNRDHYYDNIILHVVGDVDKKVRNARGEEILTARIDYDPQLFDNYLELVNNPFIIGCHWEIKNIDRFFIKHWMGALVVERLEDKCGSIRNIFSNTGNDWEETFYRVLSRYFGFRVNTEPFEMLASALPFKTIGKHLDNRFQVEALLFGTSGMLEEGLFRNAIDDDYYKDLIKEYNFLSSKYSLAPVHGWLWKFSKLRPVNFPTIRISQLAAMLTVTGGLFSRAIEVKDLNLLREIFKVTASDYWNEHFVFGKESRFSVKHFGETAADILLVNVVIPIIFLYGRIHNNDVICERALSFFEEIKPEGNSIISDWKKTGVEAASAFESQALIQLRNEYCKKRKCLDCRIGARLISQGKSLLRPDQLILEP